MVGTVVKSVLTRVLVSIPALNIYGAPIAANIAYPVMVIMNLYFIKKKIRCSDTLPQFHARLA